MHRQTDRQTDTDTQTHTCMHNRTCTQTYTHRHMHTQTQIRTSTHTDTQTQTHTYTVRITCQSFWWSTHDIWQLLQWSTGAWQVITNSSSNTTRGWWATTPCVISLISHYCGLSCIFFITAIIQYLPLPWLLAGYGRGVHSRWSLHLSITIGPVKSFDVVF